MNVGGGTGYNYDSIDDILCRLSIEMWNKLFCVDGVTKIDYIAIGGRFTAGFPLVG